MKGFGKNVAGVVGLERWKDGRARAGAPSRKGDEEGGMDHLTDPLTVAAAVAAAVVCSAAPRERERD